MAGKKIVQSASKFMRELYETLTIDEDNQPDGSDEVHNHISRRINSSTLGVDPSKVDGSDVIVSFVNQGRSLIS